MANMGTPRVTEAYRLVNEGDCEEIADELVRRIGELHGPPRSQGVQQGVIKSILLLTTEIQRQATDLYPAHGSATAILKDLAHVIRQAIDRLPPPPTERETDD
jgi:hypothetical protein